MIRNETIASWMPSLSAKNTERMSNAFAFLSGRTNKSTNLDQILCLANSYKHGNRCVAGICLATKQWVRLVGHQVPGCLTIKEASYSDGREAALLDVFEAELGFSCSSNCHPEDVLVSDKTWRPIRCFDQPQDALFLAAFLSRRPVVLQGYGDRVTAHRVEETPMDRSLELIEPEDLWWWIREENGKRKHHAIFRVSQTSRIRYDLSVTDPVWLKKLQSMPLGIYPHTYFCGGKFQKTFLTISLSEPFNGFLYKLVAGVVCLPA
jgi:hypothetical protein